MSSTQRLCLISLAAIAAATAACSGGGSEDAPTTLSISLMDAAVDDVTEVNVQISAMWIKPTGDGPAVQLPLTQTPMTVNLLAHSSENAAILVDEAVIEAGSYDWLLMDVNAEFDNVFDSFVKTNTGGMEEIRVPSGRVRLVGGFEVAGGNQGAEFLFDWDLRKALVDPPGQPGFFLHPAFRMIDVTELTGSGSPPGAGGIHGTILGGAVTNVDNDCNADSPANDFTVGNSVYIYAGLDVQPDDIDGLAAEPETTVDAADEDNDGDYEYHTMLSPGDYTVTFTCHASNDFPETNETDAGVPDKVSFFGGVNATIAGGSNIEINFP